MIVTLHRFDSLYTPKGSRILSGNSLNEISCYCPGGCGGNIPYISADMAAILFIMDACNQVPLILPKLQVQKSLTFR
jgi:hypothetical protein